MKLGENIRAYRLKENMTQEQLGEMVGVSPQAVSKWESDTSLPDTALLPEIAAALHTSTDALFGCGSSTRESVLETLYRWQHQRKRDPAATFDEALELTYHAAISTFWSRYHEMPVNSNIQIHRTDGFLEGWYYENSPLFVMMPKPKNGWKNILTEDERIRAVFAALGDEETWRAARWLMTKPSFYQFLFPVLLRDADIPAESADKVRHNLTALQFIREKQIVIDGAEELTYQYFPRQAVIALWVMASNFLYRDNVFQFQQNGVDRPVFSE